jgi:hypothetical protein
MYAPEAAQSHARRQAPFTFRRASGETSAIRSRSLWAIGPAARLDVRLRPEDRVLLLEQAIACGLGAATYASMVEHARRLRDPTRRSIAVPIAPNLVSFGQHDRPRALFRGAAILIALRARPCKARRSKMARFLARRGEPWKLIAVALTFTGALMAFALYGRVPLRSRAGGRQ